VKGRMRRSILNLSMVLAGRREELMGMLAVQAPAESKVRVKHGPAAAWPQLGIKGFSVIEFKRAFSS